MCIRDSSVNNETTSFVQYYFYLFTSYIWYYSPTFLSPNIIITLSYRVTNQFLSEGEVGDEAKVKHRPTVVTVQNSSPYYKMDYRANIALLPASIFCTVFGFSALEFRDRDTFNNVINAYCILVAALHLTFCTVSTVVKVIQTPATFANVLFVIMDAASVATLTYYRAKLLAAKDVAKDVFAKIDVINERYRSLGVATVYNTKEQLHCYGYMCVVVCIRLVQLYTFFDGEKFKSLRQDLSSEFQSVPGVAVKLTLSFSVNVLHIYVVSIIYIIKQRVLPFQAAVLSFSSVESRNQVWTVRRKINASDRRKYIKLCRVVYDLIFSVYSDVKYCYKHYMCFAFLLIVTTTTFDVLMNTSVRNPFVFMTTLVDIAVYFVLPVWLVGSITSRLRNIHAMVHNVYYENPFNQGETLPPVQEWILQCAHDETDFDCAYFTVDPSICGAVINSVSLFVFALIK